MAIKTLLKTKMEVHTAVLMGTAVVCAIIVAGAFGAGMMAGILGFSSSDLSSLCPTMTVDNYTSQCNYVGVNEACNLSQKGTIRYFNSRTNSWSTTSDLCVNIGGIPGMPSINQIAEFDCQSGKKAYYNTNCPSGKSCVDGACVYPSPVINVTSPQEGNIWTQGGTYTITWIGSNMVSNDGSSLHVDIKIVNASTSQVVLDIANVQPASGSFTINTNNFIVPIPYRQYKIKVYTMKNNIEYAGYSGIFSYSASCINECSPPTICKDPYVYPCGNYDSDTCFDQGPYGTFCPNGCGDNDQCL